MKAEGRRRRRMFWTLVIIELSGTESRMRSGWQLLRSDGVSEL